MRVQKGARDNVKYDALRGPPKKAAEWQRFLEAPPGHVKYEAKRAQVQDPGGPRDSVKHDTSRAPPPQKAAEWQPFLKGPPGQRKIRHFARAPSLCTLFLRCSRPPPEPTNREPKGSQGIARKTRHFELPPKKRSEGQCFFEAIWARKIRVPRAPGMPQNTGSGGRPGHRKLREFIGFPPKRAGGVEGSQRPYFTGPGRRPGRRELRCFPEAVAKIT